MLDLEHDIQFFESIYKKHFERLCLSAFSLTRDREIAEDIVQDVFFKLWKRRELLFKAESKDAYLYQSVLFEALNYVNRRKRRLAARVYLAEGVRGIDPERAIIYQELRQQIIDTIQKLPKKCKQAFVLSRFGELDHASIAAKLNISTSTVEKHIVKALKILKRSIPCLIAGVLKYF